jgi:hypothetical protein
MLFGESVMARWSLSVLWQVPARRIKRRVGALKMRPVGIPRQ